MHQSFLSGPACETETSPCNIQSLPTEPQSQEVSVMEQPLPKANLPVSSRTFDNEGHEEEQDHSSRSNSQGGKSVRLAPHLRLKTHFDYAALIDRRQSMKQLHKKAPSGDTFRNDPAAALLK